VDSCKGIQWIGSRGIKWIGVREYSAFVQEDSVDSWKSSSSKRNSLDLFKRD